MSSDTEQPSVAILGAGPVGTSLAVALSAAGWPPTVIWARRKEAAERAGKLAGIPSRHGASWPSEVLEAEVLILAVRDQAVAEVANSLARAGVRTEDKVLIHCAGSMPAGEAFAAVAARGKGLLHPLRAIVDARDAAARLAATTFGVEGDESGRRVAGLLAAKLGGRVLALEARQMAAYHAAAAIASNFLVALMDLSEEVLRSAGIDSSLAREPLVGLAEGALENIRRAGMPQALSGPIRRGDTATLASHLSALDEVAGDAAGLYRALGRRCLSMAERIGDAESSELQEIAELFCD